MDKLWFITNPNSGTATRAKCEALEAVFNERGLELVGRTEFPDESLPTPEDLEGAGADALEKWDGAFLILPGGTMNLLAKGLHSETDPHKIVHAAHSCDRRVALPYAIAGPHRAFVGLILGPAAAWVDAREAVRKGKIGGLFSAIGAAWRKTFAKRGVRLRGIRGLGRDYQAVFVTPQLDGLHVAAVDARDFGSIVQLGWDWLTGDWIAAHAVSEAHTETLRTRGRRPVKALFDGEPVTLDPRDTIRAGKSLETFIATRSDEEVPKP
jgi:diacylglycerol kinase family enzyme